MQLLVQNRLDPSRATDIFSVPKRRIFALPKIVRHQNKSGLQYSETPRTPVVESCMPPFLPAKEVGGNGLHQ